MTSLDYRLDTATASANPRLNRSTQVSVHQSSAKCPSKLIVLAGGNSTLFAPLSQQNSPLTFPVLNKPLIVHAAEFASGAGINELIVVSPQNTLVTNALEVARGCTRGRIGIRFHEEQTPEGTSAVLRGLRALVGDEPFFVGGASLYFGSLNVPDLVEFHRTKGAAVTAVVEEATAPGRCHSSACLSPEGLIESIHVLHPVEERRRSRALCGLYLFSPAVFDFIPPEGYHDVKEQLIPALLRANKIVAAYQTDSDCTSITGLESYFEIHRALLEQRGSALPGGPTADVTLGAGSVVSSRAHILGPVLVGENCVIEENSHIIGPAVIGNGCRIARGAVVRESILWDRAVVSPKAVIDHCIVSRSETVAPNEQLRNCVVIENMGSDDINLASHLTPPFKLAPKLAFNVRECTYNVVKRTLDLVLSTILVIMLAPVFVLVSLLIALDSPGPILFRQKRSGKNGKDFKMFKFRTMCVGAESMQPQLAGHNECDGPVFKMANDPRVTRVGRFLRKSSLDELPQLVNVIRGEMSLVGPRPLAMSEMRFSPSWRDIRLQVKPGITGLWQINGRSDSDFHAWISNDIEYIRNRSIVLDLCVLLRTLKVVFKKRGAY